MSEHVICDLCGTTIPPHAHYVVRIDVYADPSIPPVTSDELEEMNLDEKMADLLEKMKHMSADDLQDQVHRRFDIGCARPVSGSTSSTRSACRAKFAATKTDGRNVDSKTSSVGSGE